MRKSLIALTVSLLLLTTLTAGAKTSALGPFSTTGYTTNLVVPPGYPYPVPTEYAFLPNGYAKFHIHAQGGPPSDADNARCQELYGMSCEDVCQDYPIYPNGPGLGTTCGADGDFSNGDQKGSFAFDEWAIVDPDLAATNQGLLTISTGGGSTDMHFGGTATTTVDGSFQVLGGSGDYKKLAGGGTYAGNAGYVFKVVYTPCGGHDQQACVTSLCAAHGERLKLKNAKATWDLTNDGEQPVALQSLLLFWPEANGALTSVRLGGKTLAERPFDEKLQDSVRWVQLDLTGPAQDREIRGAKSSTLTLQFENKGISEEPADYTFQAGFSSAGFAKGCSAIHVAFP
jgi:hypothetical protein